MVTLCTLLTTIGATAWDAPLTVALTLIVYWPAGAVVPALVAPFQEKPVIPEPAGVTWKDVTGTPLEFAIDTVKPVAPLGALTAPAIEPPVASAAVVPGASIDWPSRPALLLSCEEDMADCMLCRLDTSLRPSSCPKNWLGSVG